MNTMRLRIRLITIVGLLLAALSSLGQAVSAETKAKILDQMSDIITRRAFVADVDFGKWPEVLARHQDAIDKATDQQLFVRAVNRALRDFGSSHFNLRTPRAAQARRTTTAVGIGVSLRKVEQGLRVVSIVPEGPAAKAGVDVGDTIIEINGQKADNNDQLGGEENTKVELKIQLEGGATKQLTLERKKFSTVRPETLTWVDKRTAVLTIHTFSNGYSRENVEKLVREAHKAKYLIIDLRSNGGGAVSSMNHFLSMLLPDNTAFGTSVSKRLAERFAESAHGDPKNAWAIAKWADSKMRTRRRNLPHFDGKVAVLLNRGSASASEITAAALHEILGAPLIGSQSAGAVLVSTFGPLAEGFQLQYPISDYITIKGARLEGNPRKPDVEAPQPRRNETDVAIAKAADKLHAMDAHDAIDPRDVDIVP